MIGPPDGDIEQFSFPRHFVICDGSFYEMSVVVVLVHAHVRISFIRCRECVVGVQVSIGLLCRGDLIDPFVTFPFHRFAGMRLQRVGHGFQCLEDVAVIVEDAFMFFALISGNLFEVPDPGGLHFCLIDAGVQGLGGYQIDLGSPEGIGYIYFGEVHRTNDPGLKLSLDGCVHQAKKQGGKDRWACHMKHVGRLNEQRRVNARS